MALAKKKRKKKSPTAKTGKPQFVETTNGFLTTNPRIYEVDNGAMFVGDWDTNITTGALGGVTGGWISGVSSDLSATTSSVTWNVDVVADSFIGEPITAGTQARFRNTMAATVSDGIRSGTIYYQAGDTINVTASAGEGYTVTINDIYVEPAMDKAAMLKSQIRHMMKNNLLVKMGRSRSVLKAVDPNEVKAQKTLRDHLTEKAFRRYITNGFIMVQGRSGLYYQVFSDRRHTMVYDSNHKKVGEICIRTDYACPPTDHVINIKMMVEFDEVSVWKGGNLKQFSKDFQIPFQLSNNIQSYVNGNGLNGVNGAVVGYAAGPNPYLSTNSEPKKDLSLVEAYRQAKKEILVA